jgi:hypothetical protein
VADETSEPLSPAEAVKVVKDLLPRWREERERVERADKWYRGHHDRPSMPRQKTSREYLELADRTPTPWLSLVVTAVAQALYVEGYRSPSTDAEAGNEPAWECWQANGMDARQIQIHRAALAHGLSYAIVGPGEIPQTGEKMPRVRGMSARKMLAVYEDPVEDEWPVYALRGDNIGADGDPTVVKLYDASAVYSLRRREGQSLAIDGPVGVEKHGAGVTPVVRYANMLDLDGRASGEVEPHIWMAARIDQDTFDRLVVQRFGAWLVRYGTGLVEPETDAEKRAAKLRLSVEDFLVSDSTDTKFGTLPATPLDGFIKAREADIRDLAAASQTTVHHLTGEMVNLSAEALAAAEAQHNRKVTERKHTFGESHEQLLRICEHLRGNADGAADFKSQVRWADIESRSLAQAADALGKMATMLNVPVELLWEKIPGWTDQDVKRARELFQDADAIGAMLSDFLANDPAGAAA